jgi:type I restriction enzyme, S subunit
VSVQMDRGSWRCVPFGDLVSNVNSYYNPAADGDLPYVAGPHIDSGSITVSRYGWTSDEDFPPTFKRLFEAGDVLLHSRGIGKLAVPGRPGVTGEKLFVLRSKDPAVLDQRFLPWLLRSVAIRRHMQDNFTGSVNKFLNWRPLTTMGVPVPPLQAQARIADLMWRVEQYRLSLEALKSKTVEVARQQSTAAMVGLCRQAMVSADDACEQITVGVVVRPAQYYTDAEDGIPALRGLNVYPGGFNMTDLVRFRPESAAALTKSTLRAGDVVVVRSGRPGDAAVVTEEVAGTNCIDLIIARPGPTLDAGFLARVLNSEFGRGQVLKHSAGTAQQHFNVGALKRLSIPLPDLASQRALTALLSQLDDAVREVELAIRATERFAESLLDQVFQDAA